MKHRLLSALLAAAMAFPISVPSVSAAETKAPVIEFVQEAPLAQQSLDAESVYNAMIALQDKYPTGMTWTNDNFYAWKGGIYSGGYGCAAFAFMLSDAAFGDLPARMTDTFDTSSIRVGDILRYSGHSFIVLEVKQSSVIAAEGNINSSIMWGREIPFGDISASFENHITRYPLTTVSDTPGDINVDSAVDASDAAMVLSASAAVGAGGKSGLTSSQESDMDVDFDGDFDAEDAAIILTYAAYTGSGGTMGFGEYLEN